MNVHTTRRIAARRSALALTAAASAFSLAACGIGSIGGSGDSAALEKGDDITVGLLLPDKNTVRFEKFDYPLIKKRVAELTYNKGKVLYANAEASMDKQSEQFAKMIDEKVDVILVDAVDGKAVAPDIKKAKAAGIPVIAYDRLAEGPIDAYVSHDNETVGEAQGRALVEALGSEAASSKIVMINGSPADPNTALLKKGALKQLDGNVIIAKQYDTDAWLPVVAKENMEKAIKYVGLSEIAAVYSASDGLAGSVIDVLKEAGVSTLPPVTGQDANLDAVQRVVSGEQYMTVYKPFLTEATNAAEVAVAKVHGRGIEFDSLTRDKINSATRKDIPSNLAPVVPVTQDNIGKTVIKDGVYTVKDICTPEYEAACEAIGLK